MYSNTYVKIIHISTDCVFSGKRGGYLESDSPDGESIYDRSKALGEIVNAKDLTFRMSIIGPDVDVNGEGLFNWFMSQQGTILGYSNALWNGITTLELARAIEQAIQQELTGLYHLTSKEAIDKLNLLKIFKEIFERNDICIKPFQGLVSNKTLLSTRTDFDFKIIPYQQQIKNLRLWVEENRILYNHYRK